MFKPFKLTIDQDRVFGLDILRFLAIAFVIYTHAGAFIYSGFVKYYNLLAYDGVGIFFVLSGFLIGGILIKQLEKYKFNFNSLTYFWIKRWSRTLPNYYLFFLLMFVYSIIAQPQIEILDYLPYVFFSQNLFSNQGNFFFTHSWSLAVEEWFYLVIPIILFVFIKISRLKVKYIFVGTTISILILIPILRYFHYQSHPHVYESFELIRYAVLYRFDCLMYGLLASWLLYYYNDRWNALKKPLLIIGIVFLMIHYFLDPESNYFFRYVFSISFTSVTVFCFLPYLNSIKQTKSVFYKPITYISLISYSLYLINSIVAKILRFSDWNNFITYFNSLEIIKLSWGMLLTFNLFVFLFFSFTLSLLNYKYFEIPTTNFFRKNVSLIKLDKRIND